MDFNFLFPLFISPPPSRSRSIRLWAAGGGRGGGRHTKRSEGRKCQEKRGGKEEPETTNQLDQFIQIRRIILENGIEMILKEGSQAKDNQR